MIFFLKKKPNTFFPLRFYFVDALFNSLQLLKFNFIRKQELLLPPGSKELKAVQLTWKQALERWVYLLDKVLKGCEPREGQQNFGREGNISNTGSYPSSFPLLQKEPVLEIEGGKKVSWLYVIFQYLVVR